MMSQHSRPLTIGLVAGEASGDTLGAGLIQALKAQHPDACFVGIGGPLMKAAGCESWFDMEALSVMGLVEVIKHLPRLLKIRGELTQRFSQLKPDVFIGIDAPDFNLTLEGELKKQGIPTIQYVSPSVWAWRQKRILKIGQVTDLVLALYPFEKQFYDRFNVPCRFIGHPLADEIPLNPDKQAARQKLGISPDVTCLALLPGSRQAEVEKLSEDFLKAALRAKTYYRNMEVAASFVNAKQREFFEQVKAKVAPDLKAHIFVGNARDVMYACDGALVASGTATLECMLAKCPMVVAYRMNPLTFWLAKRLVKVDAISLPNLLAGDRGGRDGKPLIREMLQGQCTPATLSERIMPLMRATEKKEIQVERFAELHQEIRCNANQQAAEAVLSLVKR